MINQDITFLECQLNQELFIPQYRTIICKIGQGIDN